MIQKMQNRSIFKGCIRMVHWFERWNSEKGAILKFLVMLFHWEQQRMSPSLWGNCLLGFVLQQMKEPVCLLSRLTRICFVELLCHTLTLVLTFVQIQRNNTKGPKKKQQCFQGLDFKSVPAPKNIYLGKTKVFSGVTKTLWSQTLTQIVRGFWQHHCFPALLSLNLTI